MASKQSARRSSGKSAKADIQASAQELKEPVASLPGMFIDSPTSMGRSRAATRSSTTTDTVQPTNSGTSSSGGEVIDLAVSAEESEPDRAEAENSAFLLTETGEVTATSST